MDTGKKILIALFCGILGCLCYGGGDWLMSESMLIWFLILMLGRKKAE